MKPIDPFQYIDAAQQYTDDSLIEIANLQWTNRDQLVRTILERIPEKYHQQYLTDIERNER